MVVSECTVCYHSRLLNCTWLRIFNLYFEGVFYHPKYPAGYGLCYACAVGYVMLIHWLAVSWVSCSNQMASLIDCMAPRSRTSVCKQLKLRVKHAAERWGRRGGDAVLMTNCIMSVRKSSSQAAATAARWTTVPLQLHAGLAIESFSVQLLLLLLSVHCTVTAPFYLYQPVTHCQSSCLSEAKPGRADTGEFRGKNWCN